ncbi:MAG: RNA polymerase sigma factor [Planctomycetota bacterium]|jgi:RNA polymerase sigma-70 factor (ECF subfamily)
MQPDYPKDPDLAVPQLVREHGGQLYGIARKLCGNAEDAEDLVQETFLQAYRKWSQFEGRAKPLTWLYTIASRACIRMHRKRSGEPEHMTSLQELLPFTEGEMPVIEDPLDEQIRQEGIHFVQAAILELPMDFRMPLVLKDIIGLPLSEIAKILDLKEATVKTRVHRARLKVRKELEQVMKRRDLPPAAYERQVCLDLLDAKQEALDHGVDMPQKIVCDRCKAVFASLDFSQQLCARLGEGELPDDIRERLLELIEDQS